jgi:FMN phosphatase YigB (HAD superfamily)
VAVAAVIFDCFGVIYSDGVGHFYDRHPSVDPAVYRKLDAQVDLGQIDTREYLDRLSSVTGETADQVRAEISSAWKADRELLLLIGELRRDYRTALLSNAGADEIKLIYQDGVDALFDVITVSYKVGVMKPDPEIYHAFGRDIGAQPRDVRFAAGG